MNINGFSYFEILKNRIFRSETEYFNAGTFRSACTASLPSARDFICVKPAGVSLL